jgi:fatty aldehyde-generating acyl-ACP reductase
MSGVEFALLGHQDSWTKITQLFHSLRDPRRGLIPAETLREVVPRIPPRTVARSTFRSLPSGRTVRGVYIETFITPDELDRGCFHRNVAKVRDGIRCAVQEGARVASLGGFTSIVLEGRIAAVSGCDEIALTTGNTLTAAYIVKGIEAAAQVLGISLKHSTALVVGSTGDVGSACAGYLAGRVRRLLLLARNPERLRRQEESLRRTGVDATAATDARALLPQADVVVSVASLAAPIFSAGDCRPEALVCDAGYPRNLLSESGAAGGQRVFWGGMGTVLGGWRSESGLLEAFYNFPAPCVSHGCLLEGVLLALEERYERFSEGRGNITAQRIEEIWEIAQRHGFVLAPFFNADGLWREQHAWAPRAMTPAVIS